MRVCSLNHYRSHLAKFLRILDETNEPTSLVAEDTREKSENNPALDNNKSVSSKRPNDFGVSMQKKKVGVILLC